MYGEIKDSFEKNRKERMKHLKSNPKQILIDNTDWQKLYIYAETERQLWKAKAKALEKYFKAINKKN